MTEVDDFRKTINQASIEAIFQFAMHRSMDSADRAEPEIAQLKRGRLQEKIEALKEQMARPKEIDTQMRAAKSNTSVTPGSR